MFSVLLKLFLTNIKRIEYFGDGCADQYKNRKLLYNLSQHSNSFGIGAIWNYFATLHENHLVMALGEELRELPSEQAYSDQKKVIYYRLFKCSIFVRLLQEQVFHIRETFNAK